MPLGIRGAAARHNRTRRVHRRLTVVMAVALFVAVSATISGAAYPNAAPAASDTGDRASIGLRAATPAAGSALTTRASGPVEVRFQWWDVIVSLDRTVGCFAASGRPEGEALIAAFVPPPWSAFAIAAIRAHKTWIGSRMGSEGVDLYFNWAGFIHRVEPRGHLQSC